MEDKSPIIIMNLYKSSMEKTKRYININILYYLYMYINIYYINIIILT